MFFFIFNYNVNLDFNRNNVILTLTDVKHMRLHVSYFIKYTSIRNLLSFVAEDNSFLNIREAQMTTVVGCDFSSSSLVLNR